MKPLVLPSIVDRDLCIGCGVCAAICPDNILEIRFNRFGEYNPFEKGDCIKACGLCLKVCPFAERNPDEDEIGRLLFGETLGIQHRDETGYFLETFVGHSQISGHREQGSSGGMATWFLLMMLESGKVDAVACVKQNSDPEQLFKFGVFKTAEEVRAASGSAYYPVELSDVFRYITENPGRYAVIGIPCFVKAVRLAQLRNRNLRERIVVILGLTCGQIKSKHYSAYLAAETGLNTAPVRIHFRGKDPDEPATNFFFSCWNENGDERRIHWDNGVSDVWRNRWFTPIACNYCDDIFAECADVTFMDAWLPEYANDPAGTNLAVARSPLILEWLEKGMRDGALEARQISIEDVVRSQINVVKLKRDHLADRLARQQVSGISLPKKRVAAQMSRNPLLRWEVDLKEKMQRITRESSADASHSEVFDSEAIKVKLHRYLVGVWVLRLVSAGVVYPLAGLKYLRRYLDG